LDGSGIVIMDKDHPQPNNLSKNFHKLLGLTHERNFKAARYLHPEYISALKRCCQESGLEFDGLSYHDITTLQPRGVVKSQSLPSLSLSFPEISDKKYTTKELTSEEKRGILAGHHYSSCNGSNIRSIKIFLSYGNQMKGFVQSLFESIVPFFKKYARAHRLDFSICDFGPYAHEASLNDIPMSVLDALNGKDVERNHQGYFFWLLLEVTFHYLLLFLKMILKLFWIHQHSKGKVIWLN